MSNCWQVCGTTNRRCGTRTSVRTVMQTYGATLLGFKLAPYLDEEDEDCTRVNVEEAQRTGYRWLSQPALRLESPVN